MELRDTQWDEEDTTGSAPLIPGQLNHQLTTSEALNRFVQQIYQEGISGTIVDMSEARRTISRIVDSVPPIRQEGDSLIVPIVIERMVLVKKTILLEELVLNPVFEGQR